ncbi:MAG: hypothetical protein GY764_02655 [Halieaceae bacterium]|nr:hypothetical protein [Halieaceae bacterium]
MSGALYEFVDTDVVEGQTYWYRLEDMDTNGAISQPHDDISVIIISVIGIGATVTPTDTPIPTDAPTATPTTPATATPTAQPSNTPTTVDFYLPFITTN